MKNSCVLVFVLLVLVSCRKNKENGTIPGCTRIQGKCEQICLQGKKGNNLDEAVENIKYTSLRGNGFSKLNHRLFPLTGADGITEKLYKVMFTDPKNDLPVHSVADVVSENGNHYRINESKCVECATE